MLSNYFGIIGLVFANCLNMSIRACFSLHISLGDKSVIALFREVLSHKWFLGLAALGAAGSVVAKVLLTYVLERILQR